MTEHQVQLLAIDAITVVNPRARNRRIHQEITDNIAKIGLKRPITVRRIPGSEGQYALICGQGRLESCKALGHEHVPARVVETDEETGHVMSLVENIARRNPSSSETMAHVALLRSRGYSDADIAAKIGCTASWVNNIGNLLDKGEGRLLTAVEAGHLPLHLAVSISRATDEESQLLLLDAYNRGDFKGKRLSVVRRILQLRQSSRRIKNERPGGPSQAVAKKMTPDDLVKLYQRHTAEHRRIQKRSEHAQQMLLLAQEIFKELFGKPEFLQLLSGEGLATVPQPLAGVVGRKGVAP